MKCFQKQLELCTFEVMLLILSWENGISTKSSDFTQEFCFSEITFELWFTWITRINRNLQKTFQWPLKIQTGVGLNLNLSHICISASQQLSRTALSIFLPLPIINLLRGFSKVLVLCGVSKIIQMFIWGWYDILVWFIKLVSIYHLDFLHPSSIGPATAAHWGVNVNALILQWFSTK